MDNLSIAKNSDFFLVPWKALPVRGDTVTASELSCDTWRVGVVTHVSSTWVFGRLELMLVSGSVFVAEWKLTGSESRKWSGLQLRPPLTLLLPPSDSRLMWWPVSSLMKQILFDDLTLQNRTSDIELIFAASLTCVTTAVHHHIVLTFHIFF